MSLDSILNAVIPFVIFGFAIYLFRKPLGDMYRLIAGVINKVRGKDSDGGRYGGDYGTVQYE